MLPFVNTVDAQAEQHMQDLRREAELEHLKLVARRAHHGTRLAVLRRNREHGDSSAGRSQ